MLERQRIEIPVNSDPPAELPERREDQSRWTLLASSVAGRPVAVVATDAPLTYTDGETIYAADDASKHVIMAQAALIAAGSLTPSTAWALVGRKGTAQRYLTLETQRAVHALSNIVPSTLVERAQALHNGPVSESTTESLERARSTAVPSAPAWCGTIRPLKLRRAAEGGNSASVSDQDLRDGHAGFDALDELDDDNDSADRSRFLELFAVPMSNPVMTKFAKILGMGTTPGSSDDGGEEFSVSGGRAGRGAGGRRRAADAVVPKSSAHREPSAGALYDEWCYRTNSYKPRWCTVAEFLPDTALARSVGPVTDLALRRQLVRIGLSDTRHRRQAEGDTLDVTALVDFAVGRDEASAGAPRVYEARRRTSRDLGVLVLLDASGSTGMSLGGARADGHVFDAQRDLTGRLSAALDDVGDRVATYAFYSRGRDNVRFLRVKRFDDRYNRAAQQRLEALNPTGYTRLGAAVRHATHLLTTKAGTSSTLLVVIGDGLPYDEGYEHHYAQHDARRALTEAVEQGVGCVCLSTRSTTHPETIDNVWGHIAHRTLERPQDLAAHVRPLIRHALREAAASRRPPTRTVPGRS